jgi:2-oxoisovalerate dehydrogenase E1 component
MIPRHQIVDENFSKFIREGGLPQSRSWHSLDSIGISAQQFLDLFESQIISRQLDIVARELKARSESFYTIGSAGHEGNAALGWVFRHTDMAFLHYRSGALFVQRSKHLASSNIIYDMLLSLTAAAEDPIAGGRHKVLGSVPLFVPPQTSTIASHLPKAVGCALSIRRARNLKIDAVLPDDSVILCNFGDASFNHASSQTAINAASLYSHAHIPCPIVFVCEDNGIGISVKTPDNWISQANSNRPGVRYVPCDGRSLTDVVRAAKQVESWTRKSRRPSFLHMQTVRLLGHAGSDVETLYLDQRQIEENERDDPLLHSARYAIDNKLLSSDEVIQMYQTIRQRMDRVAEEVIKRPKLLTSQAVMETVAPKSTGRKTPGFPTTEERKKLFAFDWRYMERPQHMAKLINWGLADLLLRYPNTLVFGEDVAKKGGVYNVTASLQKKFGMGRVFNTLLDETNILGTAIGTAQNGFLPIPEIQFLAYVHNAEDQIRGEAATLSFFSNGQYTNPMVIRIAGLAYQKGFGGHFHNDNSLAVFRDIPGVVIACPSNGADAVKMMRRCVRLAQEEGRVVVFIEPIALYMTKDLHAEGDGGWCFDYPALEEEIEISALGVQGESDELTIVSYANGYYLSLKAAKILEEEHGIKSKIVDLRWLAPVDEEALAREVAGCKHVLIVDECRKTGSQSEALVASIVERVDPLPKIRRLCADDSFVPLGKGATVVLPSVESIVSTSLDLVKKGRPVAAVRKKVAKGPAKKKVGQK